MKQIDLSLMAVAIAALLNLTGCGGGGADSQPQPLSGTPVVQPLSQQTLDYFLDIALHSEYGPSDERIKKWTGPIRIMVHGTPTPEDLAVLQTTIAELNVLTGDVFGPELAAPGANYDIYFVPEADFVQYDPDYVPTNYGFCQVWWNGAFHIIRSVVLVSSDQITQQDRSHLIREELTQSLGLLNDSLIYPDSIFYQGFTVISAYSAMDIDLIRTLYRPDVLPGMTRNQATAVLSNPPATPLP